MLKLGSEKLRRVGTTLGAISVVGTSLMLSAHLNATLPELDPSFAGGYVIAPQSTAPGAAGSTGIATAIDWNRRVLILKQREITVVQGDGNVSKTTGGYAVSRYLTDGSLDMSFGVAGVVELENPVTGVANRCFPKVVADVNVHVVACDQNKLYVQRLNASGVSDRSYGINGVATVSLPRITSPFIGVTSDGGRVMVATTTQGDSASSGTLTLVRLNGWNGALDTSLGGSGIVYYAGAFFGVSEAQVVMPEIKVGRQARLVLAGRASRDAQSPYEFAVVRLTWEGAYDASFGTNGRVSFPMGNTDASSFGRGFDFDSLDRIVVAGSVQMPSSDPDDVAVVGVARLTANGALDTTFGVGGKRLYSLQALGVSSRDCESTSAFDVGVVKFGNYRDTSQTIVAGYCIKKETPEEPFSTIAYLLRIDHTGEPVANFGNGGGFATYDFGNKKSVLSRIVIEPRDWSVGDRLYAVGATNRCDAAGQCNSQAILARLAPRIR
jgi:uncharacterized delta-60 repeat protein